MGIRRFSLPLALACLAGLAVQSCSSSTMRTLFIPPNVRPDTLGPNFLHNVSQIKYWDRISPADRATNFAWWDSTGTVREMNSYYDKVVVLTFFSTWSLPSIDQLTMLDSISRSDTNLLVLATAMKEGVRGGAAVVRLDSFVQAHHLPYEVLVGSPDFGFTYSGIDRVPTTFVIDRNRRIENTFEGFVAKAKLEASIRSAEAAE